MEADDGVRTKFGVVVSLLQLDDGTTRIILDDVQSVEPRCKTSWQFDTFYTHKRVDSKDLADMTLQDDEYHGLGVALLARLLASNGLVK